MAGPNCMKRRMHEARISRAPMHRPSKECRGKKLSVYPVCTCVGLSVKMKTRGTSVSIF